MRILITGATGFLGGAFCRYFTRGCQDLGDGIAITATGRNPAKGKAVESDIVQFEAADLSDKDAVAALCQDKDLVFHSAAFSSPWGRYDDFFKANVVGTQNIIDGCIKHQVKRLVHVSTPSIYFNGQDQTNIPEDYPLPKPINDYARTKLIAEERIDQAHKDGLEVVTIRPRALFGPGDQAIIPRLLDALAAGRLPIIGTGENIVDLTYIDNVVYSMICAAKAPDTSLGKKYNVTNGEPTSLWPLITQLAERLDLPPPSRQIPRGLALTVATIMEAVHKLLIPDREPRLTIYSVGVLSRSTTLDISAAKRELSYEPQVSIQEGVERYLEWYKAQSN